MGVFFTWPHTPKCITSKEFVGHLSALLSNFVAYCLLFVQDSHNNIEAGQEVLPKFMPFTMFWSENCSSQLNVRVGCAKAPPNCLPHMNAQSWSHPLRIPPWRSFGTNSFHVKLLEWCHCSHLPQCIQFREIAPSICLTKVCSLRAT